MATSRKPKQTEQEATYILENPAESVQNSGFNKNGKNGHAQMDTINGLSGDELLDAKSLLHILTEIKNGNFNVSMPIDKVGISGKICDTLNEIISMNKALTREFTRAQEV